MPRKARPRRLHENRWPNRRQKVAVLRAQQFLPARLCGNGGQAVLRVVRHPRTRIGFISPNSHNFCGSCNRVRVTVEGRLLLCLGQEDSVDLRGVLRGAPVDDGPVVDTLVGALKGKPLRHEFTGVGEVHWRM